MPNAKSLISDFAFEDEISVEYLPLVIMDFSVTHQILASGTKGMDISQYSECGSPPQLLKTGVFFQRRIANTTNCSTPTLLFYIKSILNRNTIYKNTSTRFYFLNLI